MRVDSSRSVLANVDEKYSELTPKGQVDVFELVKSVSDNYNRAVLNCASFEDQVMVLLSRVLTEIDEIIKKKKAAQNEAQVEMAKLESQGLTPQAEEKKNLIVFLDREIQEKTQLKDALQNAFSVVGSAINQTAQNTIQHLG